MGSCRTGKTAAREPKRYRPAGTPAGRLLLFMGPRRGEKAVVIFAAICYHCSRTGGMSE